MNQGDPSMSKRMENNTAAIYIRKSGECGKDFRASTFAQALEPV